MLFKEEGIGHIVIPCVTFYQDSDDTSSAKGGRRTPSKTRELPPPPSLSDSTKAKSTTHLLSSNKDPALVKGKLGFLCVALAQDYTCTRVCNSQYYS